jgi:sulfide:quinone oxidoreductase
MHTRTLILGAGFAGLELATRLSESLGPDAGVTLVEASDSFVFGYSKLDVMFGHATESAVRLPYARFAKPGVTFVRAEVTGIDPAARRVETDAGAFTADFLVVALGVGYDLAATPGLAEARNEFYSVAGAARLREILPAFTKGRAVIGVSAAPFKCPPAPSECALMLHDYLAERGVRGACEIAIVMPFGIPVPPSPETSEALLAAFAERGISFIPGRRVASLDGTRRLVVLDDGSTMPFDLFLGVPRHRAPAVVEAAGMTKDGWLPVDPKSLATPWPNVFAAGDIAATGTPKAGVFAEGAAASVASRILAAVGRGPEPKPYPGAGSCYIEFGGGRIGRVDVDFFSGPKPTGTYHAPSVALRADKDRFGSSRRARWFGLG